MNGATENSGRFDPESYLARIGYGGELPVGEDTLQALHRGQLLSIPFENFDILLGRPITLHPYAIFAKLVEQRRGGYCFELNGLFLHALRFFGFTARPLLARVHRDGVALGRGHQISLVTLGKRRWIADVGFGAPHLPGPMLLDRNHQQSTNGESFRLVPAKPYGIMLQTLDGEGWKNLYSFDLSHVGDGDIAYSNHYTATHPASFFTNHRVAALATADGRITLLDHALRRRTKGREVVVAVSDGEAYLETLRRHFGIDLGSAGERLPPLPQSMA